MNTEHQFLEAAHSSGIHLTGSIIADGALHRCHLDGHPAGWALDFTTGASMTWRADGRWARLSPADRAAIEAERKKRVAFYVLPNGDSDE